MDRTLCEAREILATPTPLKKDCGRVCGARCCRPLEGEETGMLLFPGEEEAYEGKPGWTLRDTAMGILAVCSGRCEREERPLACRLFPLLPLPAEGGRVQVRTDLRAKTVCPLARQGLSAMDPVFIEAVREAGERLAEDPVQAAFLQALKEEQDELREWRKRLGGGSDGETGTR